jgi:hypothetical protein
MWKQISIILGDDILDDITSQNVQKSHVAVFMNPNWLFVFQTSWLNHATIPPKWVANPPKDGG